MDPQFQAALIRGLVIAVPTALLAALTTWQTTNDTKAIIIATGTAFLAPLLIRFGGEGLYDSNRAQKGDVKAGDVQALPAPEPHLTETVPVR